MKEEREPAIRLFGRNLAFSGQDCGDCEGEYGRCDHDRISVMAACLEDKKDCRTEEEGGEAENKDPQAGIPDENEQDKSTTPESLPESDESPKTHASVEETAVAKPLNTETTDQGDKNSSPQEKQPVKKPDKILPCPRCNSMDTKFCYYNNYNVNQPRHFCKSCQRYWTAGGTMRSVPVGAGRRKNKNSSAASHYRHITISESEALAPNGIHHHPAHGTNATVLSFGPEAAPVPESLASVLNIAAKRTASGACNGFYKVENGGENGDDCSSGSSITTSNSAEERARNGIQESITKQATQCVGLSPIPCVPGVPWPYPWNSTIPMPPFCPNGFPMPYYPAPYWNCSVPCAWSTVPWLSPPPPPPPPTTNQKSPTLGKHSRDGDLLEPSNPFEKEPFIEPKNSERSSVLIPKTLRIDDPDEAARSSIWATLGIKNDFISRRGIFEGFQPIKGEEKKKLKAGTPPAALLANPAALSRSLRFQEGM